MSPMREEKGVSLQEYVACDNDTVMCGSRSLNRYKMKSLHLDMSL
jgi:hypothetical protein